MIYGSISIFGRIGCIEDLITIGGGKIMINFSVAEDIKTPPTKGETNTSTQWHKIIAWGDLAQRIKTEFKSGDEIFITGNLRYRNYEKDGFSYKTAHIDALDVRSMRRLELKIQWDEKGKPPKVTEMPIN